MSCADPIRGNSWRCSGTVTTRHEWHRQGADVGIQVSLCYFFPRLPDWIAVARGPQARLEASGKTSGSDLDRVSLAAPVL
jgi:hypothetical protein